MRILKGTLLPVCLIAMLAWVSCGGDGGGGETGGETVTGEVVLTVNGTEITDIQVEEEIARLFRQFGGRVSPFQAEQMKGMLTQQARDNLANKVLLTAAAEAEGIEATDDEVNTRFDGFKASFPDQGTFDAKIIELGLTEELLREGIREEVLLQTLLESKASDFPQATEEQIAEAYTANIDRYKQEEQVQASHILLEMPEGATDAEWAVKRDEIEGIHGQVIGGADFAAMAQEHSDCPSKAQGGDLGWFGHNRMVEEFETTAFALQVNEVSEVIKTRFGYHVIKTTGRKEERQLSLDEVKADIENGINMENQRAKIQEYIEGLREAADIVVVQPVPEAPPAVQPETVQPPTGN